MKVFTILVLLLISISIPVFSSGNAEEAPETEGSMMMAADSMDEMVSAPFIEFKDSEQAMMLAEKMPTVLFFNASWCPTCREAREDFTANAEKLDGVNLVLVDYDHSADLQKKYGVTYQHTFVQIDAEGNALIKWNGGGTEELLSKIVKEEM